MEYSESDSKSDKSLELSVVEAEARPTAAKAKKSKSITEILCESTTAISMVLGTIIRKVEKVDPDIFSLSSREKDKNSPDTVKHKPAKPPTPPKPPTTPKPLFKRIWSKIKGCFTGPLNLIVFAIIVLLFNSKLKKCGCSVPFSTAKNLVKFHYSIRKTKKSKFAIFYNSVKIWCCMTFIVSGVGEYLKENGLTMAAARRTYMLCRRLIRVLQLRRHPEKTFSQLIDLVTARRRDVKWGYFNECEGGIFTEQVEEIIIVFIQFGPECSKTIFGSFRQLTEKVDPDVKRVARKLRDDFLERTNLKSIADVTSHTMIRLLDGYCSKMRKYAKTDRNRETAADWTYAKQALIHLTSLKPIPENDQKIEKLVHDFAERANRAGADTYNDHFVDGEDDKYEVSVTKAAKILNVTRRAIQRWEEINGEHPCPVPGYDKKLRLKEEAFMGWVPQYTMWKSMNKKARKGKSRR